MTQADHVNRINKPQPSAPDNRHDRMTTSKRACNILVVLPGPMGDAIMSTAALRLLRAALPNARITLLGDRTVCDVLAHNDWADEQMCFQTSGDGRVRILATAGRLRRCGFDAAILLSNSFRSALPVRLAGIGTCIGYDRDGRRMLLTYAVRPFRLSGRYAPISMLDYYRHLMTRAVVHLGGEPPTAERICDRNLQLFTSAEDHREADELLGRWRLPADSRLVMLVPAGAFGPSKFWPAERFAQLADRLARDGNEVVVSCAPNDTERKIAERIVGACKSPICSLADERLSLGGLKALISRCRLIIANDTGPCHMAAAFGVPLVTLFGPTDPRWTATGYDKEIRLRANTDCPPCQRPNCSQDHRCMLGIELDDVYDAACRLLHGTARNSHRDTPGQWYQPFNEQFVPMADGNGLVHGSYARLLEQAQLGTLQEVFAFEQAERLDKPQLGRRSRLRVKLPGQDGQERVFYIKRYEAAGTIDWLKRFILRPGSRPEAGVHDFDGAMTLAENGLTVPRPIAYGSAPALLGQKRSFAIIEGLGQADALERLLPQASDKQQDYKLLGDLERLIRRTAQFIGRMHRCGLYHRDLYLSHIFLSKDRDSQERLCLIDLQRVFRPRFLVRRWQVKDLAQLYYSARAYFSRSQQLRFLLEYAEHRHSTGQDKRLVRDIIRKAERIRRHDEKRLSRANGQP